MARPHRAGPTGRPSQQGEARAAKLCIHLQEPRGSSTGTGLVLCTQLVTQGPHLPKQLLRAGGNSSGPTSCWAHHQTLGGLSSHTCHLGVALTRPGPEGPGDVAGLRGDQALLVTGGPSQRDRQGKGARGTAAAPLLPTPACSGAEPAARLLAMGMAQHHGVGRHLSVCACVPRDAQLETALSPRGLTS